MTRDFANELLFLWKVGAQVYPAHVITQALYVTGDLDGPHLEAEPRLVRIPSLPGGMESLRVGSGSVHGERAPGAVLEVAGPSVGKDAT